MMLRIGEFDVPRPSGDEVADIVKRAGKGLVAVAVLAASRTRPMLEIAALLDDLGLGQILRPGDPFRGIWPVLAGTRHGTTLLGQVLLAKKLPKLHE